MESLMVKHFIIILIKYATNVRKQLFLFAFRLKCKENEKKKERIKVE